MSSNDTHDRLATQSASPSTAEPAGASAPHPGTARAYARPSAATQLRDPHRYQIINEHGRGGLGRVSRAHDLDLGRDVAIKELISRGNLSEVRFLREALITARLEHPGIVPVHEAGRWPDGTPFYAMKLVAGRPLRDLIAERTTITERIRLLHHVIAVADAIAYAHGRNIIHRDLKPANVIVGDFGETIVIDWGLAKDLSANEDAAIAGGPFRTNRDDGLTDAGSVLGTPAYMAPEQERGEYVDQRADVFAIGAMLWELCALHKVPPRERHLRHRVLRKAGIDKDLVAIIDKAVDPDPEQRYPEAGALAADLKAFKSGARIAARSYSLFGMLAHWTRRHRALAVSMVAVVVVAIGASMFYVRSVATERDRADTALARVEATNNDLARERTAAIEQRNSLILGQATAALDSDPTRTLEWLKTYPMQGSEWDRVQVIAADANSRGVARHVVPSMSQTISISPDGKLLLTAGPHDLVQLWDLATASRVGYLKVDGEVTAAVFAPDGNAVAIGGRGGNIVLWSPAADTHTLLGKLDGGALYVAFSSDGRFLASSGLHVIAVWDVTTSRQEWSLRSSQAVTVMDVAPTGKTLAYGTSDGALHVTDLAREHTRQLQGHRGPIKAIAFSADGRWLATGGVDHGVWLWDPLTGAGRLLGAHDGLVRDLRFSPTDSTVIASGGADHKLRLWSTAGRGNRVFSGHTDMVNGVMFSPDGRMVASVSPDRQVRLWDVASGDCRIFAGHRADLGDVRFSPDGAMLVSSGFDKETRIWSIAQPTGRLLGRHENEAQHAVFSPTGLVVASSGADRTARLWNLASGNEQILPHSADTTRGFATELMFSASGELLASVGDNAAHLWNLSTGTTRDFVAPDALLRKVAITVDGRLLAAADSDGRIRVWRTTSDRPTLLAGHNGEVTALAFLPRGDRLVSSATDGTLQIWDVSSSRMTGEVLGQQRAAITKLAVAPDGRLVASGGRDGMVHLWDPMTHTGRALAGHTEGISGLELSRDGRLLASSSMDGTVRVWRVDTGEVRVLEGHDEAERAVAFSPDATIVASGANDRTVRLWNLQNGAIAILRGHQAIVRSVAFSPDGKQLVTTSEDATVRLWDLSRVTWVPRDRLDLTSWLRAQTTAEFPSTVPMSAGSIRHSTVNHL